jgi:hypothetical protein
MESLMRALFPAGIVLAALVLTSTISVQPAAAEPARSSYHDQHVAQQQQCVRERQNNAVAGAVLGGILGAVLGSQVAADGHRGDGTFVGGVLGAAAGAAVGDGASSCGQPQRSAHEPEGRGPSARAPAPYDDGAGLDGGPYGPPVAHSGRRAQHDCRWGESVTRDPDGRAYRENVYMCRGRDGVWRTQ